MTDQTQFKTLLPEIVNGNATFSDMEDAMEAVFAEQIDFPISQLLRLRYPNQNDDVELRKNLVRLLGFDVTKDFMDLNEDIFRIPYMFSQYYTTAHTDDFYKFISFILGRTMTVSNLYTENYHNFYAQPLGLEQVDGGTWYKTTHVDVSVDMQDLDGYILSSPDRTYQKRILDLFYEYAPIQLVIRRFLFATTFNASTLGFCAGFLSRAKFAFLGGLGLYGGQLPEFVLAIKIEGPSSILEGSTAQYRLELVWSTDYSDYITFADFVCSDPSLLNIDSFGTATTSAITANHNVTISANYGSHFVTKTISIVALESVVTVMSVDIIGAVSIQENNYEDYVLQLSMSDGSIQRLSLSLHLEWTSSNASLANFLIPDSGRLTTYSVSQTQPCVINSKYTDDFGNIFYTSKQIEITNVDSSITLAHVLIEGPSIINEAQSFSYKCIAQYSDANNRVYITPIWYLATTAATIDNSGLLTTELALKDIQVTLYATYEFRGVSITASMPIYIRRLNEYVVQEGSGIVGPDLAFHQHSYQYNLSILWSDGQKVFVKADAWYTTRFWIDTNGVLKLGIVDVEGLWIELVATFTYMGITYEYTKYVRVVGSEIKLDFISIRGQQSITPTETKTMIAYAHYSDGTRKKIVPTWSVDVNFASISTSGALKINGNPTSTSIQVKAHYNSIAPGNVSLPFDAVHYVAVKKPAITVDYIEILGVARMAELSREHFTVNAHNTDGSIVTGVKPDWSIDVTEVQYTASDLAMIDRKGNLAIHSLVAPTRIIINADYFGVKTRKLITLEKYSFPKRLSPYRAIVDGPSKVDAALGYAQYTLYMEELQGMSLTALSADWSITLSSDIAEIDQYGVLRVFKYQNLTTTVTGIYDCGFVAPIIATKIVTIPGPTVVGPVTIEGPSVILDESVTDYRAYIQRTASTRQDVTVTADTKWTIAAVSPDNATKIALTNSGKLIVQKLPHGDSLGLQVTYTDVLDVYQGMKTVTVMTEFPTYGVGMFGLHTQADVDTWVNTPMATTVSGGYFTINVPTAKYGYFLCPVSYGKATFIDPATNFEGAWDGASWPLNEIGADGPIIVDITRNGITRQFNLYRTDWSGGGLFQTRVFYANR